jgi:PAP2 superfamily
MFYKSLQVLRDGFRATVKSAYPAGEFWIVSLLLLVISIVWAIVDPKIGLINGWYQNAATLVGISVFAAMGFHVLDKSPLALIFHRLLCMVSAYGFAKFTFLQIRTHNYLSMSLSGGWKDKLLDGWDRAIGFDWTAYSTWLIGHPWLTWAIKLLYAGVDTPIAFLGLFLIALGSHQRVREYFATTLVSALVCIWTAAAFPAKGALALYNIPAINAVTGKSNGIYHIPLIELLKDDQPTFLNPDRLPGLAAFPSFHASLGFLLIYYSRENPYLLAASTIYSLAMMLATPLYGGHYLVDLIAGIAVAIGAIVAWRLWAEPHFKPLEKQPSMWSLFKDLLPAKPN